ncbi:MAG: DUF4258 domain-containing protein [Deltaproteobacteria bacterium]|nr:DUF4258 domain-containing protein [Deltaproteobacteria bacterium]
MLTYKKYAKSQAVKLIRKNLVNGGVATTAHFRQRMEQRKVSMQDVIYLLKTGSIFDEPELDMKVNQWKYKVEGKTIDGASLAIVVALEADKNILITCMRG